MSVEAELKARLTNPAMVRDRLGGIVSGIAEVYRDTYLDTPDGTLETARAELRVRTVERDGTPRHVLTFKGSPVDEGSQSKPEHETDVDDPGQMVQILAGLGYVPVLTFTKNCLNYRFTRDCRDFLATVATVPELEGTFLEVETQAPDDGVPAALAAVYSVLMDLGVSEEELTTDTYSGAVRAARGGANAS